MLDSMPASRPGLARPGSDTVERAVRSVPLSLFIGEEGPLTNSASRPPPASVVRMLKALQLHEGDRVLQIGVGSGYVTAALAELCGEVHAIEIAGPMLEVARRRLAELELPNVHLRIGDGSAGWAPTAPYDAILVVAREVAVGPTLTAQLAPGGVIVSTEGARYGDRVLVRHQKDEGGVTSRAELGTIRIQRDIGDALESLGVVPKETVARCRSIARIDRRPLQDVIAEAARVDERDVVRALAQNRGLLALPVSELLEHLDSRTACRVPRAYLDHHRLVPVGHRNGELLVATTDPHARHHEIEAVFPGETLRVCLVTVTDLRRIWSAIDLEGSFRETAEAVSDATNDLLDHEPDQGVLEGYAVSVFEALLLDAIGERASDIHLEQFGERVRVRLRIDGDLQDIERYALTPTELSALVNVIKVRANLDIAERRLPQGGRIRLRAGDNLFDLRVQTQPSLHGEHIVIRLLPQQTRMLSIEDLGFPESVAHQYRRLLDSPSGMVLVVGPTGSGKSTTLYAGLQELAREARRKVITVEDPIEYSIDGIQQTQVKPGIGFNFADAMRAFVREDPDVIFIGEIRDSETALEAIRASQTGHLVLSTLHCNDAVDAVQRLYDLGMHPNSIASELLAIISQRLTKRVCRGCREPVDPDVELLAEIFPAGPPAGFRAYAGRGCDSCGGRGTRGRVAAVEFLPVNAEIRRAVSRQPALDDLRELAERAGLHALRTSLLAQVQEGLTPIEEMRRLLHAEAMAG